MLVSLTDKEVVTLGANRYFSKKGKPYVVGMAIALFVSWGLVALPGTDISHQVTNPLALLMLLVAGGMYFISALRSKRAGRSLLKELKQQ